MKKIHLILILLMLASGLANGQNKQLNNFEQVFDALKLGLDVSVVIHYADCEYEVAGFEDESDVTQASIDAIGGMKIDANEYFAPMSINNEKAYIVTSRSKLIENPLGKGYVYNYVKLKVDEDNQVTVSARYLKAKNYETIMDENFYGEINNGSNDGCVYFYVNN